MKALLMMILGLAGCSTGASRQPGSTFKDCTDCPEMTVVPAGAFVMGSPPAETGRFNDEGPTHRAIIHKSFAVMRAPVTLAEFTRFAREVSFTPSGACNHWNAKGDWEASLRFTWQSPGFRQSPSEPVVCVSWLDGQRYARWLSAKAGYRYRFLTETEFEYAARAGSVSAYPWGSSGETFCRFGNGFDQAARRLYSDLGEQPCDDGHAFTSPVRAFPPNPFGLFDMTGNAFQWVQDCFVEGGYAAANADSTRVEQIGCKVRVIRGGSWANSLRGLRSAMRDRDPEDSRYSNIAIRLARDLN